MKKGFTLVELIIVLAIIGVFTAVVFGSITTSRSKARDNSRIADMKQIELALVLYYDVNRYYPSASGTSIDALNILIMEKYLPSLPADPQVGNVYEYKRTGNKYCLGVKLEGAIPGDSPEVQTACAGTAGYYWASR
ncbi:MAG: prepilin-type N-terminal cleavage/methylation domain-containing protein [Patescibacteria group bacterium]